MACPEELWLRWTTSTDDIAPVSGVEYEVRVTEVINEVIPGGTQTVAYTGLFGANTVTTVAVDQAGNASAPSNAQTRKSLCRRETVDVLGATHASASRSVRVRAASVIWAACSSRTFGVLGTGDADAAEFCRAYRTRMVGEDAVDYYQDVTCSFCARHNQEVRVVAHDRLVICQVCVAKCAEIFDDEVGVLGPPGGWTSRWPLKA